MPHLEDLTGQRFGRLVVTEFKGYIKDSFRDSNSAWWTCQCDCGNIENSRASTLKRGLKNSCGCLQKETTAKMGKGTALPQGESSFNQLYSRYKYKAAQRGYEFSLSKDEARLLFESDCFYCGDPPRQISGRPQDNGLYTYNGIDRLNNDLGYIEGNVVPACGMCNFMKLTDSFEEFMSWIKRVHDHQHRND